MYLSKSNNYSTSIVNLCLIYIVAGISAFLYLLYYKNKSNIINNIINNYSFSKLIAPIIVAGLLYFFGSLLVIYTFSISPNVSYVSSIINSNIILLLLFSYFFLKEKFNIMTLLGIIVTFIGIILIINYSK
jgi:drug/metabolite transporter (DMT)-like permease